MQYKTRYTFAKIDQDLAPDKRDTSTHFDIVNFELFLTSRGASLQNTVGPFEVNDANQLAGLFVIGDVTVGDQLYIWTTDNNTEIPSKGSNDAIWELEDTVVGYTVTLIQQGNWSLTTYSPIQAVGIDESTDVRKLYWVDGFNQARYINTKDPTPIVDFVKTDNTPGTLTAEEWGVTAITNAVVRYAYTLYDTGGTESKLSFFTDRVSLKDDRLSARLTLDVPTPEYENYRIYRVMWETYNDAPTYSIISEGRIPVSGQVVLIDTGALFISAVSLEEIVDLGSDVITPKCITFKKKRLFFGNYKSEGFEVDPQTYDLRAFFHSNPTGSIRLSRVGGTTDSYPDFNSVPYDHDAIAKGVGSWKYQADTVTLGAEGPFSKITLVPVTPNTTSSKRVFKSNEVYRIGVVCKDALGRETPVYWVCDITIPPLDDTSGAPGFWSLNGQLKTAPGDTVSYKFVYVERTQNNMTILGQAIPQPLMDYRLVGDVQDGIYPFPTLKEIKASTSLQGTTPFDIRVGQSNNIDFGGTLSELKLVDNRYTMLYTPETLINRARLPITDLGFVGVQEIFNSSTRFGAWNPSDDFASEATVNGTRTDLSTVIPYDGGLPDFLFDEFDDGDPIDRYAMFMYYRRGNEFHANTIHSPQSVEECKYIGISSTVPMDSILIQNLINKVKFAGTVSNDPTNYQANYGDALIVKMVDQDWAGPTASYNYEKFAMSGSFNSNQLNRGIPVVDLIQDLQAQYGGDGYDARSFNTYLDCSGGTNQFGTDIDLQGDVYCGLYAFAKTSGAQEFGSANYSNVYDYIFVWMESSVDVAEANNTVLETAPGLAGGSDLKFIDIQPLYSYDTVFSQIPNFAINAALKFNHQNIVEFPVRITPSSAKEVGETVDNWTKINTGTYIDLESPYGALTSLERVRNDVIAFQPRAIAGISILPDSQALSSTGQIQLGKGKVLDDYNYLTIENGVENFQAIAVYGEDVYFIDTIKRTLNSLSEGEISILKGFNSTTKTFLGFSSKEYSVNYEHGVFVWVNNDKKQVLFKYTGMKPVLVYNAALKVFTNTRTYERGYYFMSHRNNTLSAFGDHVFKNDAGVYGYYYGTHNVPSKLVTLTEPMPGVDKVFDAISVLKNGTANFTHIQVDSPTRTSGLVPTEFKHKYDLHNMFLPRVEDSRDRFRERNIKLTLELHDEDPFEVDELFLKYSIKKP